MSTGNPSRRTHRARSEMGYRRTSMDSMKAEFRNKFLERLRKTRSKSVDRFRRIVENYETEIEYRSLNELRQVLLADQEAAALINTEEVSDLLQEVEAEMRQVSLEYQAETYARESEKETEDAVKRLMSICPMCQYLTVDVICPKCSAQISSEFK